MGIRHNLRYLSVASIHMSDSASGSGVAQAGLANKTVSCDGE